MQLIFLAYKPILGQHTKFWYLSKMRKCLKSTTVLAYPVKLKSLKFSMSYQLQTILYASIEGPCDSAHTNRQVSRRSPMRYVPKSRVLAHI